MDINNDEEENNTTTNKNTDIVSRIYRYLSKYDITWCKYLNIKNPYINPDNELFTNKVPIYDKAAAKKYPEYEYVYDKLWVANNQGLESGTLEELLKKKNASKFPIFIKPRYGTNTARSVGCYKINSYSELEYHKGKKEVMWSEFIDGKEEMTDFILWNGKIVYQLTYLYSETQIEFVEIWKHIDNKTNPPKNIEKWVLTYMKNYSGIVNVQYRKNTIIEVSLRPARGGSYLKSSKNRNIINSINHLYDKNEWLMIPKDDMNFKPFYSFKCHTYLPILYIPPFFVLDTICDNYKTYDFNEYYFEKAGNKGCVFYQFYHDDFDTGLKCKNTIESIFNLSQLIIYLLILFLILALYYKQNYFIIILSVFILIYLTRFINPISSNYSIWKTYINS